jgi:hypothetical protein
LVPDRAVLVIVVVSYHYAEVYPQIEGLLRTVQLADALGATRVGSPSTP